MTQEHPITPPPELVEQWYQDGPEDDERGLVEYAATQAARWGADQELEACCSWADATGWYGAGDMLRTARRSKPPSLKANALMALEAEDDSMPLMSLKRAERFALIRRALESLPD